MTVKTVIRHRAGALNRWLQAAVLASDWLPDACARGFGSLHGQLMTRAYAARTPQTLLEPRHFLARLLEPGDVMLDVGASYGLTAAIASRRVGPSGRVYAFEPQEEVFQTLDRKRGRFGWANVEVFRTLVGERTGEEVLYQHPSNSEISSLSAAWNADPGSGVTHSMVSLDDWAEERELSRVDLVKIDVEGAEMGVVRGARRLLRRHRPVLLIEINNRPRRPALFGYTIDDLLGELRDLGYGSFSSLRADGLHPFEREADLEEADRDMLAR